MTLVSYLRALNVEREEPASEAELLQGRGYTEETRVFLLQQKQRLTDSGLIGLLSAGTNVTGCEMSSVNTHPSKPKAFIPEKSLQFRIIPDIYRYVL